MGTILKTSSLLGLLCVLAITGCRTVEQPSNLNYFFVNKKGDIVNPETNKAYSDRESESAALRRIIQTDRDTIMVYIHGGLNTKSGAIERALEIKAAMNKSDKTIHPIFINWQSGGLSTHLEHIFFHRKGEHWSYLGPITSPLILIKDLGRSVSRLPRTIVNTGITYAKTYKFSYTFSGRNAYQLEKIGHDADYFGSLVKQQDNRSKMRIFTGHLFSTFTHTLGIFGNFGMDFVGPGSWDVMKRRIEFMFVKPRPKNNGAYTDIASYSKLRKGGLNNFLKILKEESKGKQIVLVGHSMGTFVANSMLSYEPRIKYERIIYMAAACPIKDFQMTVIPYMVNNKDTEFYNYMLDPKAENLEANGFGLGGTGSFLVQIDDILERPVADNHKTLGRWENVMNGLNFFDINNGGKIHTPADADPQEASKAIRKRIHLITLPFDKFSPTKHGDFDDIK